MRLVRSWGLQAFALPALALLGIAGTGCSGNNTGSTTMNAGGGGDGGSAGMAGAGGTGGQACTPETEICDMVDNDCDGEVDNVDLPGGCACNDGARQSCYAGPAGTEGIGACLEGSQTCQNGTWGECVGQVVPADEACNLVDDDCNGAVDDMGVINCGVGACAASVDACLDGQPQSCVPGQPSVEVCDGIDNNCNQLSDESDPMLNMACLTGTPGVCSVGKMVCKGGALSCAPNLMATEETCDGKDNDCDGTTDNNIPGTGGTCATGQLGVCEAGTISCQLQGGSYQIDCFADVAASPEICDGKDNNCDGTPDDGNPEGGGPCDTGLLGVCQAGTLNCVDGAVTCTPDAMASPEVCDGLDNNCDGQADEGDPGGGQACGCSGAGVTACENGALACGGGPVTYFFDDFKDNSKGWTLGPNWQIGPAVGGCSGCTGTPDPATDHTPTADNGLAGVVIGGPAPTAAIHDFYWLESPPFDTSQAAGSVYLSFWRWLNSDYLDYMQNKVQVYDGNAWVDLPYGATGNCCPGVMDAEWTNQAVPPGAPLEATSSAEYPTQFDLTPYKSANMRIRFGYRIGSGGVYTIGSWSVDDVVVASAICP